MNETIELQNPQIETSSTMYEKSLMNLSDVTNLEIDITTLGIDFEVLNPVEYEDSDEYIGVQIVKLFSKPLERILISSLDVELLKENFSEIFDDYEIEVNIEESKTIGKSIKQYQLTISIFKDRDLWEESYYV